jgi:2-oxoglutarate ferredoxin oxidoreductase subunit alpha
VAFPADAIGKASKGVKGILVVEMNQGQMIEDVRLASKGRVPVGFYGTTEA